MRDACRRTLLGCVIAVALGCEEDVFVATQCPSPLSGEATVELGDAAPVSGIFGTSCAPCAGDEVRFDDDGCPIYVTPEGCGGPVCIGGAAFGVADDDASIGDAATDDDAGADDGEDAGG